MATLKTLEAQFSSTTVLNSAVFTSLLRALDARFTAYTDLTASLEAKEKTLLATGLARLNDVVGPIAEKLLQYTTLGFLVAQSSTTQLLTPNTQPLFVINDETQRELFTPSPFVVIERAVDTGTYAVAKTLGYNKNTGELQLLIQAAFGDIGTVHSDWVITASSGLSEAVRILATQAQANADTSTTNASATNADRTATHTDRVAADASAAAAATSAAAAAASAASAATSATPVSYGVIQALTAAQQVQAKQNIGAMGVGTFVNAGTRALDAGYSGYVIYLYNGNYVVTLPLNATVKNGSEIDFVNNAPQGTGPVTLTVHADDAAIGQSHAIYYDGTGYATLNLYPGESIRLVKYNDGLGWFGVNYTPARAALILADRSQPLSKAARLQARQNLKCDGTGRSYILNQSVTITPEYVGKNVYMDGTAGPMTVGAAADFADGDTFRIHNNTNADLLVQKTAGDPYTFNFGGNLLSSFTMKAGDRCQLYLGADAWNVASYTTAKDMALMADRGITYTDAQKQQLLTNADIMIPVGQCRLNFSSPTQVLLVAYNGNRIFINGNYRTIPAGGVAGTNATLAANTRYYVYAYWTGSAISLLFNTTGPQTDNLYGHQVYSGAAGTGAAKDAANRQFTLVGMVWMNGSGQFQKNNDIAGVASWFNRLPFAFGGSVQVNGGTNANAWVPLGAGFIALCWGESTMRISTTGFAAHNAAGSQARTQITSDGTGVGPATLATGYASGAYTQHSIGLHYGFSEGAHTFSMQCLGNGGGAQFTADLYGEVMI